MALWMKLCLLAILLHEAEGWNATNTTAPDMSGKEIGTTNNITNAEIARSLLEYKVFLALNQYRIYGVIGVGLPGNIMSFVTALRMKPYSTASVWITFLAIHDSITLLTKLSWRQFIHYSIDAGDAGCVALYFFLNVAVKNAVWLIVCMTAERLFVVMRPLQAQRYLSVQRTLVVVGIIFTVEFGISMFYVNVAKSNANTKKPRCVLASDFLGYWNLADLCINVLFPSVLLIVGNTLIIKTLTGKATVQMQTNQKDEKMKNQQKSITRMLVTVSVAFIILMLPESIWRLIHTQKWWTPATPYQIAVWWLLYSIVRLLYDLNNAVNFYLYFLAGKRFREAFLQTLCFGKKKQELATGSARVHNSSHTTG